MLEIQQDKIWFHVYFIYTYPDPMTFIKSLVWLPPTACNKDFKYIIIDYATLNWYLVYGFSVILGPQLYILQTLYSAISSKDITLLLLGSVIEKKTSS